MRVVAQSALAASLFVSVAFSQTFTSCNPLQQSCPADPALGRSMTAEFTSQSSDFSGSGGTINYGADGASLIIQSQGQAPTLESDWYIMFGKVDVTMKAASGTGIVSSFVMQSDDLDEIDLEWLGGDPNQVQSNYFGKGITGGYDRGAFHPNANSQTEFQTYSIIWDKDQVIWQINGQTVRVLTATQAGNQFPQTPMKVKIGAWAGGDPSNSPGTISWAGGQTDYSAAPFTMYVKSVAVSDYSTGTEYSYGDNSGSWQSIRAAGGSVGTGGSTDGVSTANMPASSVTSGQPVPFSGTHTQTSPSASCYTGRPDGWVCSANGKVLPPSAGSTTPTPSSSPPSQASPSAVASSGRERSSVTGAPEPVVTKIPPMPAGGSTAAPTTRVTPTTTVQQAAAPPVSTGAAMGISGSRIPAALGLVAGLAYWL